MRTLENYNQMMGTLDQRFTREDYPVPSWSISYNRGTWLQWEGMAAGGGFRVVSPVMALKGVIPTAIVCHTMQDVDKVASLIGARESENLSEDKQASKLIDRLIDLHGKAPEHPLLVDLGYQLLKIKQELDRRIESGK